MNIKRIRQWPVPPAGKEYDYMRQLYQALSDESSLRLGDFNEVAGRLYFQDSVPASGRYRLGSTVFNSSPAIGEPIGWRCTVAGEPGTWDEIPNNHSGVYEPVLGNPSATGYVLSSTDAGVRSWIAASVPSAHVLVSATHTASGLTSGHFLKATGATSYGFGAHGLTYSDVGADVSGAATTAVGTHESTNNHANYNTAYGWGNHAGLYEATGAVSTHNGLASAHGFTNAGKAIANLTNPGAITFLRVNADNTASLLSAGDQRTALGLAIGTNVQAYNANLTGINQALDTTASPSWVTAKFTALTDGYIPYHVSDAAGLANGPIWTDGTIVGIGTATPGNYSSIGNNLVIYEAGNGGITIATPGGQGYLNFADGTTGNESYRGILAYLHSSDEMVLYTSGTEKVRVTASGSVLIGATAAVGSEKCRVNGNLYCDLDVSALTFTDRP